MAAKNWIVEEAHNTFCLAANLICCEWGRSLPDSASVGPLREPNALTRQSKKSEWIDSEIDMLGQ